MLNNLSYTILLFSWCLFVLCTPMPIKQQLPTEENRLSKLDQENIHPRVTRALNYKKLIGKLYQVLENRERETRNRESEIKKALMLHFLLNQQHDQPLSVGLWGREVSTGNPPGLWGDDVIPHPRRNTIKRSSDLSWLGWKQYLDIHILI